MKHYISQKIRKLKRFYYEFFYGFDMNYRSGTMLPKTGKGKYVSVYRKGDIIQIIDERSENNEIRIIPFQPNHGVMIESLKNGKLITRNHLDIEKLNTDRIYFSYSENNLNNNK